MDKVYVVGHQKPDTDSITSAISLSYLKKCLGINAIPCRIGDINSETKYVLSYFNINIPPFLEDVKLQLKDLSYYKNCYLNLHTSILDTYNFMIDNNITGIPIVDEEDKFIGLITLKVMMNNMVDGEVYKLNTSYDNLIKTLEAEEILKFNNEIVGSLITATYRSSTFMENVKLDNSNILIVGDRNNVIEYAINNKVKLIIVVGGSNISPELITLARNKDINIIRTKYDTFKTTKLINLANYIHTIIPNEDPYTFNELDYYDEFVVKTSKLKHNNYPILGKNGKCMGLIRITDITQKKKKKVILVDHNEINQSVEGLDEAEIIEIVDHHKLGNISTNNPINFRNMSVGATNTIVYEMFKENHVKIPRQIAGIMLAGILSDTLILTSPTTTELDKKVANELAEIVKIDYHEFALDMFKVGTSLKGKTIEEIVNTDIKTFNSDNILFAVSQVFTLDIDSIISKKEEFISYINELSENRNYKLVLLVITDVIRKGSYLLYNTNSESSEILEDAFNIINIEEGYYIDEVVSRKKQIIPKLMDVMR